MRLLIGHEIIGCVNLPIYNILTLILTEHEQKWKTAENNPSISTGALECLLTLLK